jgi:hypothetical protein
MRSGNLDNRLAIKIGIRAEAVIFNFGALNKPGKAFAEASVAKGFNVLLVTLLEERKIQALCYKWAVPYTQCVQASSNLEIPEILLAHGVVAYADTDERLLSEISMRGNPRIEAIKWTQEIES